MENISKKKFEKYIEEMKDLHEKLLFFIESAGDECKDYITFEELKDILAETKIRQNRQKLKLFLKLILNISNNHHRSLNFFERIEQILKFLEKTIKQTFSKKEIFNIFVSNKKILFFLFKENIIKVNKNIVDFFLEDDEKHRNNYCHFFYPEVKNFLPEKKVQEIEKELLENDPDCQCNFYKKRLQGENEKYLFSLIRDDKVEEFIEYINFHKISRNISIEPSIYETNPFLISSNPSLIEYASFFGSIQIFQYLFINGVEIDEQRLSCYAIHSNNANMIHLLESKQILVNNEIIEKIYLESIKCHHNQISEYIKNNLMNLKNNIDNEEDEENIVKTILKYSNYFYFPKDIERNFAFYYLCKYKYSKIILLFLNTKKQEIDEKLKQSKSKQELLRKSADENKIYIIYYLLTKQTKIKEKAFEKCEKLKKLPIPSTIKTICEYSFNECTSLIEINIPSSVISIEQCSFYNCSSLTKIKIPKLVKSIEPYSFYGCSSLQKVSIPSSVTSIGAFAFSRCNRLEKITIPKSILKICQGSFCKCHSLISISLPSSIIDIESHAFYECSSLIQIEIPLSIAKICKGIMKLCKSLTKITIPRSIRIIDSYSFSECSLLARISVEIPSSLAKIGKCAFSECSSLVRISIPSSVTAIGNNVFYGCSSLTQISIPSSVTLIGNNVFYGCSSLAKISIPSSITSIKDNTFNGCSRLRQISIPSSITSIRKYAFCGCSELTQISIPSSITSIRKYAFAGCSRLTQISIPSSITSIGEYAFFRCSELTQISIPSSVTSIRKYAFAECSRLAQISIPSSITSIKKYTFCGCSSLAQISIPTSVTSIEKFVFFWMFITNACNF